MSHELHYTSAPKGLKPGSRGYCTVASTAHIPPALSDRLEGLSGYRQVFTPHDPSAADNPVVYSHLRLNLGGQDLSVLSRVAAAGLDYSDRSNKYAHHVVLDPSERAAGGPAWVASQPGFFDLAWSGEPRILPAGRRPPSGDRPPSVCRAWGDLAGDPGWAGVLAEAFLADPSRPAYLVFQPGQELLPLLVEAIALLPPRRRWDVGFSTYLTTLPHGLECAWRGVLADSPEVFQARRTPAALVIDLTAPLPPARGGELVQLAYSGVVPPGWGVEAPAPRVVAVAPPPRREPTRPAAASSATPVLDDDLDLMVTNLPATGATPPPLRSRRSADRWKPPRREVTLAAAALAIFAAGVFTGWMLGRAGGDRAAPASRQIAMNDPAEGPELADPEGLAPDPPPTKRPTATPTPTPELAPKPREGSDSPRPRPGEPPAPGLDATRTRPVPATGQPGEARPATREAEPADIRSPRPSGAGPLSPMETEAPKPAVVPPPPPPGFASRPVATVSGGDLPPPPRPVSGGVSPEPVTKIWDFAGKLPAGSTIGRLTLLGLKDDEFRDSGLLASPDGDRLRVQFNPGSSGGADAIDLGTFEPRGTKLVFTAAAVADDRAREAYRALGDCVLRVDAGEGAPLFVLLREHVRVKPIRVTQLFLKKGKPQDVALVEKDLPAFRRRVHLRVPTQDEPALPNSLGLTPLQAAPLTSGKAVGDGPGGQAEPLEGGVGDVKYSLALNQAEGKGVVLCMTLDPAPDQAWRDVISAAQGAGQQPVQLTERLEPLVRAFKEVDDKLSKNSFPRGPAANVLRQAIEDARIRLAQMPTDLSDEEKGKWSKWKAAIEKMAQGYAQVVACSDLLDTRYIEISLYIVVESTPFLISEAPSQGPNPR